MGSLAYAAFWLLAAAPKLGSADLANESLSWLAVPSVGLLLLGIGALVPSTAFELFAPRALDVATRSLDGRGCERKDAGIPAGSALVLSPQR